MSKMLLLAIASFLMLSNTQAQWIRLTTAALNADLDMTDVFAYNQKIIATGFTFSNFQGQLLISDDEGKSWTTRPMEAGKLLKTIAFKDADTGFIAGYGSITVMYKSTDGGNTWNKSMEDFNNTGINDMRFLNDRVGIAVGYSHSQFQSGQCYKTYDGGLTWDSISAASRGCLDTTSIDNLNFVDARVGYGWSDLFGGKTVTKTVDSGKTFSLLYTHTKSIAGLHFWNVNDGILADADGDVFRTSNGGQNWNQQANNISGTGVFTTMQFMNQTTGFAGDGSGRIYKTIDGGQTWKAENKVASSVITRIRFSQNRAYAVARGGHVLRSEVLPNNVDEVLTLSQQLNIYPNPASDLLNDSSYQGRYQNIIAAIADVTGKTIAQATTRNGMLQIPTATLAAGNYVLTVNADGKTTSTTITIAH